MAKKVIVIIVLTVIFFISSILIVPIVILSEMYFNSDFIDKRIFYYYTPSNFSTHEELNLNINRSNVNIRYVDPSYHFSVKIEVHFEISGANVLGKSYSDYFNIEWENSSSPLNFSMVYKPGIDPLEVSSLLNNVSINVFLRSDIVFDINTEIDEGNVDLLVNFMVLINNIDVNIERGNIAFNFIYCVIGGNITGSVNVGDIIFRLHDVQYTRNCFWNLTLGNGDMLFDIIQYKDIGANITGVGEINIGELRVLYNDYNPNVGALFIFHNAFGTNNNIWEGFKEPENEIDENQWWLSRFLFYSNGFPGLNYYNVSLYRPNNPPDSGYVYNLLNTNNTI